MHMAQQSRKPQNSYARPQILQEVGTLTKSCSNFAVTSYTKVHTAAKAGAVAAAV